MIRPSHRRRLANLGVFCAVLASPGCVFRFGPSERELGATPRGVTGSLGAGGTTMIAEVLAVDSAGLIVLAGDRVGRLRWSSIDEQEIEGGPGSWEPPAVPDVEALEWLRRASRFPRGLSDDRLDDLLEFHGQDEPDVIGAPLSGGASAAPLPGGSPRPSVAPAPAATAMAEPTSDLLDQARTAALRYRAPEEARLSGYRPIGPDFPGMGQHWVNAFLLLRGGTDPSQPPFLTYLDTPSGTVLTGLALGRVVAPDEVSTIGAGREEHALGHSHDSAWHDHSGTIDEELLALSPDAARHAGPGEFRLSMLHLWTDLENPEGPFAQDNWAIPYRRLGLPIPESPTADEGKALFLASGGDRYYRTLIDALAQLGPEESRAVDAALSRHRAIVEGQVATASPLEIARVWPSLWAEVRAGVTPAHWGAIEALSR